MFDCIERPHIQSSYDMILFWEDSPKVALHVKTKLALQKYHLISQNIINEKDADSFLPTSTTTLENIDASPKAIISLLSQFSAAAHCFWNACNWFISPSSLNRPDLQKITNQLYLKQSYFRLFFLQN
jgi:hypothetical protein